MAGFGLYYLVGHAHSFVVPTYEPLPWFMIQHHATLMYIILFICVTGYGTNDSSKYCAKKDVLGNRGSLGQRQKVFIHYVPTSYESSECMGKLEKRIYNFSSHLITYGFDVRVDLFCDKSTSFDRLAWSDHELSQANWVIFVCSKSSYELLNSSEYSPTYNTCRRDQEARSNFTLLRRTLYNQVSNNANINVIPVILLQEDNDIAYVPPTLQDQGNIYYILEDTPFDYENLGGHFERLICRMAGINRAEINAFGSKKGLVVLPSKILKGKICACYN